MLTAPKQRLETFLFATQGKRRSLGLVWLVLIMCVGPLFAFLASPFPYPLLYLMSSPALAVFLAVQVRWGYQWTGWLWLWLMRLLMGLTTAFMFFAICLTGGINSPQLIWLASVPLVALFMMGQRATLVLLGLVMLLMGLLGWATSAGLLPDQITFLKAHVGWALGSHVAATLVLCTVPLLFHWLYSRKLRIVKNDNLLLEKAHQALVQAEAYKDEFIAGVGHDLRTPMFTILGLNDVLRHELRSDPRALATVDVIRTSTDRLLQLTNHILDYSQLRAEQLRLHVQPVNLPALLQGCLQEFQPRAQGQVRLVADLAPDLPNWLWADRQRLREVLCHLLDNAFKFTASGEVCLQAQRRGDWLTFGVQDTGVGVPLALQNFIFNRFEHADEETHRQFGGAGLGLSICEQLVRLFGGKMTLLSQPGKGACFRFSIPLQLCDAPVAGPEEATRSDQWRILLVDDDALNLQVTALFCLRLWPAAVVSSAHNGPEALALLRMQAFDVVMMDAFIPGMDGAEVTGLIRSSLPAPACQVPVIGLTASRHPQDRAACLAAGMNDVLCKPLDQASLLACVQQLGQPSGGPPLAPEAAPSTRQAWPEALRTRLDQVATRLLGNRQRRFFWAYSLAIVLWPFVFAFSGLPEGPHGTLLISIGLVFVLLLLGIAAGMPSAWSAHLGSSYSAFVLLHDATLSGGIFSPSIGWLIIFPLGALIIIGKRAFLLWLVVVLVCLVGMAAATGLGYVPGPYHATPAEGWWALTNYMAITLMMVLLPFLYADLYNKGLRKSRQRHTELLDKQAELLRAQDQKSRFIAALSHEMRTPMNAILGFNELLQLHAPTPRVQALVSKVRQSGDHLLTLINDILDYSQIQTGQIVVRCEAFTLADTVRNAFELFAPRVASMKIDYRLDLADDLPEAVLGDRHRLMQILVNLLGNAIKFTRQGSVTLDVRRDGQSLLFAVQDTGIGIEASRQASIFERFTQATPQTASLYGGNGLGLAICRQLVQLLDGTIGVDSEPGRGSRFWFRLTMPDAPVPAAPVPVPPATPPLQAQAPLRVLVVDDSPINLMLASAVVLARWPDAQVKEAEHGLQAIDLLRVQPFDLILMDMVMPVMDGIAATEALRTQLPAPACQTPVIGLTANVNEQDHARGLQAGMNAIILKPFDRHKLYAQMLAQLAAAPVA